MRLSALATLSGTFLAAAGLSLAAASLSARVVEDSSITGVARALEQNGIAWAEVDANGLQVFVYGAAPSEADRFRALSVAGQVVDAARVIDELIVEDEAQIAAPRFSVEILRNEGRLSLIGLVPEEFDRERLIETLQDLVGDDTTISDLLESAAYPTPDGWAEAMRFAARALEDLPRAKISVDAERVAIEAMTESRAQSRDITTKFDRIVPDGITLALDLKAPRPVVSPFALRFLIDEEGARFDTCAADTEAAQAAILSAARDAGAAEETECRLALGTPSPAWGQVAADAIRALGEIGAGTVTFSNTDIALLAAEGSDPDRFATAVGRLENTLPEAFVLDAVLPTPPEDAEERGPVEFVATVSPEGQVALRGLIDDEVTRVAAESFARAAFGSDAVRVGTRFDDELPRGWRARVLAGLEALSRLKNGAARVTPETIEVTGDTGNAEASAEIAALLTDKLGSEEFLLDITYRERLDPTLGIPSPEECVAQISVIIGSRKITFEPGSATLDASAKDILDEVSDLLKICGDIPLEIQGHTDSQGREVMNEQLSQERAQAVLFALTERRVLTASYRAVGYGEAQPIADNGTADGREANRRIEFTLIPRETPAEEETTLESVEAPAQDEAQEDSSSDTEETGE
ncbi:putative lipoprotein YiaD precursor [Roseivivax sp. THAF40]|uniref:OmpA family protein n=1 Tax=unclassified Roseivivax TaxID=2639302 RepID=UPI001268865B|nr:MULTISPECIES: OmpA family protein [unclassified Roseivivax]QFS84456.1 putative lipoprotein YiaD precursor [Roseivivax sp. THAF197b]QFT48284.1 putative lipoprotein YiaD precursor [Roseivivax sp. THAF40]